MAPRSEARSGSLERLAQRTVNLAQLARMRGSATSAVYPANRDHRRRAGPLLAERPKLGRLPVWDSRLQRRFGLLQAAYTLVRSPSGASLAAAAHEQRHRLLQGHDDHAHQGAFEQVLSEEGREQVGDLRQGVPEEHRDRDPKR